mmetsp:Transcript_61482/g.146649  ORF Transcript_61482/g.146649 Transcript_61482/m.146649 type:complete len:513 (+) Transcript_61482:54-1592(+)
MLSRTSSFAFWLALLQFISQASGACPASAKSLYNPGTEGVQINAELFSVTYYSTYKVVKYNDALGVYKAGWPNTWERGARIPDLVLYQCDTEMPTTSYNGVEEDAMIFEIPIQRAALPWTGVLHFFEMLSLTEAISQIDMSYISSPCMQLLEVCTPGIHESNYGAAWKEHVATADAVFTDSWGTGYSNSSRDVVFDVTFEPGALKRVEWIRFLALFFNEEPMADDIMSRITADYNALKAQGTMLAGSDRKLRVAWISSSPHSCPDTFACPNAGWHNVDGSWCRCGGWAFTHAFYKETLVEDAGAEFVTFPAVIHPDCAKTTANDGSTTYACLTPAIDHFKSILMQADMIVDETGVTNHGAYTLDDFMANYWLVNDTSLPPALAREVLAEGSPGRKNQQGHSDCPLFDESGAHDCDAIHDHEHEVPICAPTTTSTTAAPTVTTTPTQAPTQAPVAAAGGDDDDDNSVALGLGLGLGLGIPAIAAGAFVFWKFGRASGAAAGGSGANTVIGQPV